MCDIYLKTDLFLDFLYIDLAFKLLYFDKYHFNI